MMLSLALVHGCLQRTKVQSLVLSSALKVYSLVMALALSIPHLLQLHLSVIPHIGGLSTTFQIQIPWRPIRDVLLTMLGDIAKCLFDVAMTDCTALHFCEFLDI